MKNNFLILSIFLSLSVYSQTISSNYSEHDPAVSIGQYSDTYYSFDFSRETPDDFFESQYIIEGDKINFYNTGYNLKPLPPILTTNSSDLEICTGNSTRLTASSSSVIHWYTTPPPIGTPVGTGTSYITPVLSTGYYTYYAIAENDGLKSDISAMEVIMVYPTPTLTVLSSAKVVCANETAVLTVSGTSFYEWENGQISSQITVNPSNTTSYKVTGINTAGCKSTAVFTQEVETCSFSEQKTVGVPTQSGVNKLYSVYPNPNNGEFNVSVNSISESTKVEVYNGLGQLVYSSKLTSEVTPVTLKDYPNGIYILRISENDQLLKQDKIIKQ